MSQIFETILSMSIGASVLAVLVLAARAIISRRQTVVLTILFAMLIAKLVVPLSIESRVSIFNILPKAVAQSAQIDTIGTPVQDDADTAAIADEGTAVAEQGGTIAQADSLEETEVVHDSNTNEAAETVQMPNGADAVAMPDTYADEAVSGDGTAIAQAQLQADTAEVSTDSSGRAPPKAPMSLINILAIVWLIGMAVMASIIAASNIAFMHKVRRNRAYTSPGFDEMLRQCAHELHIRQTINAVQMSDINTVAVCGIVRPKLLISPQVFDALSEQEKRHVIMHELGHIKRKDTLVCLILTIVNVLHWFNPIVWIAFMLFRKDLEIMCDSKVLRGLPRAERNSYAKTLLELVSKTGAKRNRLAMAMFMSKAGIKRRIAMIAKYKRNKPIVVALALILAVGIAITGCTVGVDDVTDMQVRQAVEIGELELLASHTIDYSDFADDDARVHNIRKAAALLNGMRIGPDEQMNLLEEFGPITKESGWEKAQGVTWDTVILLLGHEDTENEMTLDADPHTIQIGGGVGLVAAAYCIVGINAGMDQIISGDMEGLITEGGAGLHNWFDTNVVFETVEVGDTIIVNLYGPGNFDEQMERLQAENREGIADRETTTEFLTVYTFGKLSVDLSFCADDENILSNIVKTMDELEGKVFSPGKSETLISSDIYDEDGWETAPARSWEDIGGLDPDNIRHIENLETQVQRGGGSELVLAAVKGAAIEAGLSVTSLDPGEAVLNEYLTDVTLLLMIRDSSIYAAFVSQVTPIDSSMMASYAYDYQGRYAEESFANVDKALKLLGVIELEPGEEISLNEIVGNRATQGGWGNAQDIVVAHKEPGKGGGVCFVATAIYNAAIRAELEVIEVNHHAILPIDMPAGLDATLSYTGGDLKIKNPYDVDIVILTNFEEGDIVSYVFGPKMEYEVYFSLSLSGGTPPYPEYHYYETMLPNGEQIPAGESVTFTEGAGVTQCKVYKKKYDKDGNEIESTLFDTVEYKQYPAQIYVNGPAPSETPFGDEETEFVPQITYNGDIGPEHLTADEAKSLVIEYCEFLYGITLEKPLISATFDLVNTDHNRATWAVFNEQIFYRIGAISGSIIFFSNSSTDEFVDKDFMPLERDIMDDDNYYTMAEDVVVKTLENDGKIEDMFIDGIQEVYNGNDPVSYQVDVWVVMETGPCYIISLVGDDKIVSSIVSFATKEDLYAGNDMN